RQLVPARFAEMEAPPAGKIELFARDLAAGPAHGGLGRVQIPGIKNGQRRLAAVFRARNTAIEPGALDPQIIGTVFGEPPVEGRLEKAPAGAGVRTLELDIIYRQHGHWGLLHVHVMFTWAGAAVNRPFPQRTPVNIPFKARRAQLPIGRCFEGKPFAVRTQMIWFIVDQDVANETLAVARAIGAGVVRLGEMNEELRARAGAIFIDVDLSLLDRVRVLRLHLT